MSQIAFLLTRGSRLDLIFIFAIFVAAAASSSPEFWFWNEFLCRSNWKSGSGRGRGRKISSWFPWFSCSFSIALVSSHPGTLIHKNLRTTQYVLDIKTTRWVQKWNCWSGQQIILNQPTRKVACLGLPGLKNDNFIRRRPTLIKSWSASQPTNKE